MFGMPDQIEVLEPRRDMLVVRHSRVRAALVGVGQLLLAGVLFYATTRIDPDTGSQNFLLAWPALVLLIWGLVTTGTALSGREYVFDDRRRIVTRNGRRLAGYDAISSVQLRIHVDTDTSSPSSDTYRLTLTIAGLGTHELVHGTSGECICLAATRIAERLRLPLREQEVRS